MPPTTQDFRRAAGFLANGITVVTTRLGDVDHAMTANSFTTVSLSPLLVLVCAERGTRFLDAVLRVRQLGGVDPRRVAPARPPSGSRPRAGRWRRSSTASRTAAGPDGGRAPRRRARLVRVRDDGDARRRRPRASSSGRCVSVELPAAPDAGAKGPLVYYRGGYSSLHDAD